MKSALVILFFASFSYGGKYVLNGKCVGYFNNNQTTYEYKEEYGSGNESGFVNLTDLQNMFV